MNSYEARQEARRERLLALAARLEREGNARYNRARELASLIPMGQPILVGHHSEKRDRNFRDRIHNMMGRGFADMDAAKAVAAKAEAVGSGGISSDDPDAVVKLRSELASLEANQRNWKALAAAWRKAGRPAADNVEAWMGIADAVGMNVNDLNHVRASMAHDALNRGPVPDYRLANNNANMRRIKGRIAQLERRAAEVAANPEPVEKVIGGVRVVEDPEENRLRLIFPGKPPESVRSQLKAAGFRWSPSAGAWQRQINNAARWAAQSLLERIAA